MSVTRALRTASRAPGVTSRLDPFRPCPPTWRRSDGRQGAPSVCHAQGAAVGLEHQQLLAARSCGAGTGLSVEGRQSPETPDPVLSGGRISASHSPSDLGRDGEKTSRTGAGRASIRLWAQRSARPACSPPAPLLAPAGGHAPHDAACTALVGVGVAGGHVHAPLIINQRVLAFHLRVAR